MTDQNAHLNRFSEPDAIDELMDRVADQLQSQMHAANRKLRSRAARLLNPSRTRPKEQSFGAGVAAETDTGAGMDTGMDMETAEDEEAMSEFDADQGV